MTDYEKQDKDFENAFLVYKSMADIGTCGFIVGMGGVIYGSLVERIDLISDGARLNQAGFMMLSTGLALGFGHLGYERFMRMKAGWGLEKKLGPEENKNK